MKLLASTAGLTPALSPPLPDRHQPVLVTLAVLLAHAGLLAWLQASPTVPVQPPQPAVITMELLASRPAPVQASRPAPQPEPRQQAKPAQKPTPKPAPRKVPAPVAQPVPSPLPTQAPAVAAATTNSSSTGSISSAPATPAATGPATAAPGPAKVELPSASADYLNNPKPAYPPLSRRLREEGKVVLRVLIETDGTATKAEVRHSSGYERLDQAALQTVLKWRYLPARRNGTPEAMWFNIPINFVLE